VVAVHRVLAVDFVAPRQRENYDQPIDHHNQSIVDALEEILMLLFLDYGQRLYEKVGAHHCPEN
jgi:hypothetical protein